MTFQVRKHPFDSGHVWWPKGNLFGLVRTKFDLRYYADPIKKYHHKSPGQKPSANLTWPNLDIHRYQQFGFYGTYLRHSVGLLTNKHNWGRKIQQTYLGLYVQSYVWGGLIDKFMTATFGDDSPNPLAIIPVMLLTRSWSNSSGSKSIKHNNIKS